MSPIPRVFHQTWKSKDIPEMWREWSASWCRLNPGWEHRLWTDEDNRAFLAEHYPWFLPTYDGYRHAISRVDAVRYFILSHHGGVYTDLDFECLRPLDQLLDGEQVVLGCEPAAHTALPIARGMSRIIGNAFMASVPGHPLWTDVHRSLVAAREQADPLDVAGPFFLTRAVDEAPDGVTVLSSEVLYPDVSPAALARGAEHGDRANAYAVHHWSGTWIKQPLSVPVRLMDRGRPVLDGRLFLDTELPDETVSCLMVTRERPEMAKRAIRCFQAQTYPLCELVIVDDGPDTGLAAHVESLADPGIRHIRLPDEGRTLGELRQLAVEQARGAFVAQWDDDDLSHPDRLAVQMTAVARLGADMCLLLREQLWWPERELIATSVRRLWEGAMVCAKAVLPPYDDALTRGEDTPVVEQVCAQRRVALLDLPELYTYVMHGANTFDEEHFAAHFRAASDVLRGSAYAAAVARLPQ